MISSQPFSLNEISKTQKFLYERLQKGIAIDKPLSTVLLETCDAYYNTPVHDLQGLKSRNTKIKGDIFEYFCQIYLEKIYGLKQVWLLSELPDDIRQQLGLHTRDLGIDLIGIDTQDRYYAIQAKFRKRPEDSNKKIVLTWKALSTFYGLCARTGPYYRYIVMTTADYVRRVGHKTAQDITIGWGSIKKITHFQWLDSFQSQTLQQTSLTPQTSQTSLTPQISQTNDTSNLSREKLREKRLQYYSTLSVNNKLEQQPDKKIIPESI